MISFKSGQLTLDAYEEDCEFADPAGSFKGLPRFKRNCTNFGSLIEKSNMKLMKWEDFEVNWLKVLIKEFHLYLLLANILLSKCIIDIEFKTISLCCAEQGSGTLAF